MAPMIARSTPGLPLIALLGSLLFLAGCAVSGPKVGEPGVVVGPPPADQARIVFYRGGNPFLLALEPQIVVNSLAVGRSIHGAVFYKDAKPGRYKVFLGTDLENPVYLILRRGDKTFVKIVPELQLPGSKLTAYEVSAAQGEKEIQGLALNDGLGDGE